MEKKTVLVTGIGGNVGQGIIRNIRSTRFPVKVIGCNTVEFSAGNHLCDKFYSVPYAYDPTYIPIIRKIVNEEKVDLIIPSTDYEVYHLAKSKEEINCEIVVSEMETTAIYLDKYKSYIHHNDNNIPFAKSYLPSEYDNTLEKIIIKPREGRGSRGIHLNPKNIGDFGDDYVVQELHRGKELTTAFYVSKEKKLHGFITLERWLENGATNECRVNKEYDYLIEKILLGIIDCTGIKGSSNLQSIVTDRGEIFPFEINCRISGTNSIRSNFGFEDVKYTLEEYLYGIKPSQPEIIDGVAVRILMDVIYPHASDASNLRDNSANFHIY